MLQIEKILFSENNELYVVCNNMINEILNLWKTGTALSNNILANIANRAYGFDIINGMELLVQK